ncbi:MAG: type II toxin-antitoxin system RelE/ParE family toxin [Alphaproteobacteria bacterium]|nr:type II toxin-antitoxin system RelE/ParE family toxin [Alphaproteobacteria bacterium]
MRRLRLSPRARADLDGIWTYSVQTWNLDQCEAYLRSLDGTMKLLCEQPALGTDISDIRGGYRKFPTGSHLLIYKFNSDHLEIIRILHKSSDVVRHV